MNPWEKFFSSFRISKNKFVIRHIPIFRCSCVASPSISSNRLRDILTLLGSCSRSQSIQKVLNGVSRSIVHYLHVGEARMFLTSAISIKRHSAKNIAFPLASSSSLRSLGCEKGIVHLNQTRKAISGVSIRHGFSNLVTHQPSGSALLDIKKSLHLGYRYPNFVHRHMVEQPIPLHQRRSAPVKNRSCRQTCLKPTHLAVVKAPIEKVLSFLMAAPWANISICPSFLCKVLCTGFIIRKFFLEFDQTTSSVSLGHFSNCPRICCRSN